MEVRHPNTPASRWLATAWAGSTPGGSQASRLALVTLALALAAIWLRVHVAPEVTYITAPITRGPVEHYVAAAGTAVPPERSVIARDPTAMKVETHVNESDVTQVRVGNPASFTAEALPDRFFRGHVIEVRESAQPMRDVMSYDIVASLENPDSLLKPGMTGVVRLLTDRHDHTLRVPEQALRYAPVTEAEQVADAGLSAHVWILRRGKPTPVPVTVGLLGENIVEITSGALKPGDEVIVAEHSSGAPGAARG